MTKTNRFGEYLRASYRKDLEYFFGNKVTFKSEKNSKAISYEPIIDEDTIIIRTNNLSSLSNMQPVLLVGNNKAVYLKEFNIRIAKDAELGIQFALVKLSRKYFKVYTFKTDFEGFSFDHENTFDELKEIAATQTGDVTLKH